MTTTLQDRPIRTAPPPAPRRHRWLALALTAVLAVGATAAVTRLGGTDEDAHGAAMMSSEPLAPEVRGTYRFDDGTHLTLFGTAGMPFYEAGGERVMLRVLHEDRFAAWDDADEELVVRRDGTGAVTGVALTTAGRTRLAARDPLVREQEVTFRSGGVTLAGRITLPMGDGPHPAVVLVHGAEAATREPYGILASHFARRGVAALAYDKRGVGDSEGSYTEATFDDLTGDSLAGLEVLRRHAAIDPDRVGMAGFSQGGWIIAMAAERSDDVAFVIPVSASGFTPAEQARWLDGNQLVYRGLGRRTIETSEKAWRMLVSTRELVDAGTMPALSGITGFWFHSLDPHLDSAALWEGVRQPVLGIWGELDCQVPARESLEAVREALERGGSPRYSLRVLPRADHSISLVGPCAQETTGWSVTRFSYAEGYFDVMAGWTLGLREEGGPPAREVVLPTAATASELGWHQDRAEGVAWLGSFLPQTATMVALLLMFAAIGLGWVGRLVVAAVLRRGRPAPDPTGPLALWGLVAMLLALVALFEILLLSDAHAVPIIGGATPLGITPVFLAASVAAVVAVGLGVRLTVRILRSRRAGARAERIGVRTGLVLGALAAFAAWAAYWNLLPTPGIG